MRIYTVQNRRLSPRLNQQGFAYMEVMLSAVLLAVLLVPALRALQSGVAGGATSPMAARPPALSAKMEEVLSRPFPDLYAETYNVGGNSASLVNINLSDAAGATDRRVVVIYRYDSSAKALSASDTGLLFVHVYYEAEGSANAIDTLAGRWW